MRSVTKQGMRPVAEIGAKKRGRPRKVKASTVQVMQESNDPDIQFVRDLTVTDRTEILAGADTTNFRYRWVEESRIGERKLQGYSEVDDPGVKTYHEGNYWKPEGVDRKRANKGGLKLMKIPMSLAKKRDAIKAEKVNRQSEASEQSFVSDMRRHGGEVMSDAATSDILGGE